MSRYGAQLNSLPNFLLFFDNRWPIIPRFDTFDEGKENFKQYRNRFENYLQLKNVSNDGEKKRQFLDSVGTPLYTIAESLIAPVKLDSDQLTYKLIAYKLEAHLCPRENHIFAQHRFLLHSQLENEIYSRLT